MGTKTTYAELERENLRLKVAVQLSQGRVMTVDTLKESNASYERGFENGRAGILEVSNYMYKHGLRIASAYSEVYIAKEEIRKHVLTHPLFLPASPAGDKEPSTSSRNKEMDYFIYLNKLAGEFAKVSREYYGLLITEQPQIEGIRLPPNTLEAARFLEIQSGVQDAVTAVLEDHSKIKALADAMNDSPLTKDFVTLVENAKRRDKPADLATINAIKRVDDILASDENCTVTAAINRVIKERTSTASYAALWAAYYRIHPKNSVTHS